MSRVRSVVMASLATGLVLAAGWWCAPAEAHKAITSKYQFNEDVFPLFRDKCARCHVEGGVAPMSLMTYDDAAPWAESLRLELTAEVTPPHHAMTLTARELDVILVWATGGAPRGLAEHAPPPVPLVNTWGSGTPDVVAPMPAPGLLPAAATETTVDTVIPLRGVGGKRVTAIDLLPGTPAIVRSATLLLRVGSAPPRELATWLPGRGAAIPLAAPVVLAEGSTIVARLVYKRTWKYEGQDLRDTSTVGLYFRPTPTTSAGRAK